MVLESNYRLLVYDCLLEKLMVLNIKLCKTYIYLVCVPKHYYFVLKLYFGEV
jgi:hypothetical protein